MTRTRVRGGARLLGGGLLACALALPGGSARGADGDLDPSFGSGGLVTTVLAPSGEARAVAIQPDGKIVIVGTLTTDPFDPPVMVVARYTASGALDPSFGGTGWVTAEEPGFGGQGRAVAIQPDGAIVAVGITGPITHGTSAMFVRRYLPGGTPDPSFGTGGVAGLVSGVTGVGGLALDASGGILIAYTGRGASFAPHTRVLRLQSTGAPDAGFGSGGFAAVPLASLEANATLRLRDDGRIVVAAGNTVSLTPITTAFAAARLLSGGGADTSFGTGGASPVLGDTTYVAGTPAGLALRADGRLVLAGAHAGAFALVGMQADGGLDPGFGTAGLLTDAFAAHASAVVALAGGRLAAAGGGPQFALTRVTSGGTLDGGFGAGGRVTTSFGDPASAAYALAMQPDGAAVLAGWTGSASGTRIALARYLDVAPGRPGCGDGVLDAGEECDDGNTIGGDCCSAVCTVEPDGDGDGVCDARDECPLGGLLLDPRLVANDPPAAGCDGRLAIRGTVALAPGTPLDPITSGVRVVVRDAAGAILADETLPGGGFDAGTQAGWRSRPRAGQTSWKFARPPAAGLLDRARLVRREAAPDLVQIAIGGRRGCFGGPLAAIPLAASVVLAPPRAAAGECGEARFPGLPGPNCRVRRAGAVVVCR